MKNWRPKKGWDNPNEHLYENQAPNNIEIMLKVEKIKAFEDGADAMLKGLIKFLQDEYKHYEGSYYGNACLMVIKTLKEK